MIVPSTIVCGTSGCMPKPCSPQPVGLRLSCTAFTHEEPISSPIHCLAMEPLRRKILSCPAAISKNCLASISESFADLSGNAVLLHLIEQGAMADLEQLGGVGPVTLRYPKRAANQALFERARRLLDRQICFVGHRSRRLDRNDRLEKAGVDRSAVGEHDGAFDHVLEVALVAGPRVAR